MREKNEKGAIVVEATLSMTAFMFAILILLSIADIAYTQTRRCPNIAICITNFPWTN